MDIRVPKIEPPQRPMGESLVPAALSAILWPLRMQAQQEALMKRTQAQEDIARQGNIAATQKFGPTELEQITGLPTTPTSPEDVTPPLRPGGITTEQVQAIQNLYPTGQPYGTSTRQFENVRSMLGLPGGKVKTTPSFTGYGPQGEAQFTTVPQGVGTPIAKAPQVTTEITPEGGQKLIPKVPGAQISTPGGIAKLAGAKQGQTALYEQVMGIPPEMRGTPEYQRGFMDFAQKMAYMRAQGFSFSRGVSNAFDMATGAGRPVSWAEINADPGRYKSASDPIVRALTQHETYAAGISRFVNRLDQLGGYINQVAQQYALNTGTKPENVVIQDLIRNKLLGEGDIVGFANAVNAFGTEAGKVETGSIGIAGATVEAMKRFSIPYTMNAKELAKTISVMQGSAHTVSQAMQDTRQGLIDRIYTGSPYKQPATYKPPEAPVGKAAPRLPGESIGQWLLRTQGK